MLPGATTFSGGTEMENRLKMGCFSVRQNLHSKIAVLLNKKIHSNIVHSAQ